MKELLISDLHNILFCLPIESDPDNWDLRVSLAKAFLTHHRLWFKDRNDVSDSRYWETSDTVQDMFFHAAAPGIVPSVTAFECMCDTSLDFETWEAVQAIKPIEQALNLEPAVKVLRDLSEPAKQYAVTMLISSPDKKVA